MMQRNTLLARCSNLAPAASSVGRTVLARISIHRSLSASAVQLRPCLVSRKGAGRIIFRSIRGALLRAHRRSGQCRHQTRRQPTRRRTEAAERVVMVSSGCEKAVRAKTHEEAPWYGVPGAAAWRAGVVGRIGKHFAENEPAADSA